VCPSIPCPKCQRNTWHKGVCENTECRYNPTNAPLVNRDASIHSLLARFPRVRATLVERPFLRITVTSHSWSDLDEIRLALGYGGEIWERSEEDLFVEEHTEFGFDLVKNHALPFVRQLDPVA
jgi:hypothetical protein